MRVHPYCLHGPQYKRMDSDFRDDTDYVQPVFSWVFGTVHEGLLYLSAGTCCCSGFFGCFSDLWVRFFDIDMGYTANGKKYVGSDHCGSDYLSMVSYCQDGETSAQARRRKEPTGQCILWAQIV